MNKRSSSSRKKNGEQPGPAPLWLLMHGTNQDPKEFLQYTGLGTFLQQRGIAFLALEATGKGIQKRFNVGRGSLPVLGQADDLGFARAILARIVKLQCIDRRKVYCTGYSNGARFCMMLASKLSGVIAAVAPVSGLRYPNPNDAKRAMPVLAFHGTADKVNPWAGKGDPAYWNESVPDAFEDWAKFNKCRYTPLEAEFIHIGGNVYVKKYSNGCQDGASVSLVKFQGAGHQWPGALKSGAPWLGKVEKEIDANRLIFEFFSKHSMPRSWNPSRAVIFAELSKGTRWDQAGTLVAFTLCAVVSLVTLAGLLGLQRCARRDTGAADTLLQAPGVGLDIGAEESHAMLWTG